MGALPKRRISTHRKGRRRAVIKQNLVNLITCKNCDQKKQSHIACPHCGHYSGKQD